MEENFFNTISEGVIGSLTHFIHSFSGLLQILIYLIIGIFFSYALIKAWQCFRALARLDVRALGNRALPMLEKSGDAPAPLAVIAASFYYRARKHYLLEQEADPLKTIPPDAFIQDAAFQYSEKFFEERFLNPIAMVANLMPPLGFIGTIIGMVVHFLSSSGALNTHLAVAGIATALYTTFIAMICYTILEFFLKIFSGLARRRIDEGVTGVTDKMILAGKRKAAPA